MGGVIHFDDLHISRQWFEIGKESDDITGDSVAFKFIAYWISFNAIFAKYYDEKKAVDEKSQICELLNNQFESKLKGIIDYDNSPVCKIFRDNPVFKRQNSPRDNADYLTMTEDNNNKGYFYYVEIYQKFMKSEDEKERLYNLLLMIKQVRNNLFHGQKTPYPERNYQLVNSSQEILRIILEKLI